MSSSAQGTSSNSIFQLITNALADYVKQTGVNLTENPFLEKIERSDSPEAMLELLQDREKAFEEYRERGRRLITCISPAVKVLHAFSGIIGEAASLVSLAYDPVNRLTVASSGPLLTSKGRLHQYRYSPRCTSSNMLFNQICNISLCQAASGISSSYDALLDLFECVGNFLKRLEIYTTIAPTTMMTDIVVKIMLEVLSVLALATRQIKQGRFSKHTIAYTLPTAQCAIEKFAKKLLGEREVEAVLNKLDRLTQDEARMTVAQTLGVVHGLVGNIRVVMEGARYFHDCLFVNILNTYFVCKMEGRPRIVFDRIWVCVSRDTDTTCADLQP